MAGPTRNNLSDLRGAARMAFDATAGVAGIVEKMHRTIQVLPVPIGRAEPGQGRQPLAAPLSQPARRLEHLLEDFLVVHGPQRTSMA